MIIELSRGYTVNQTTCILNLIDILLVPIIICHLIGYGICLRENIQNMCQIINISHEVRYIFMQK